MRLVIFFTLLIIVTTSAFAQKETTPKFQRFGFLAGLNYSSMKFNKAFPFESTSGKVSPKLGFLVGFILRVPLTKKLTLQPEYIYSERSADVGDSNTRFKLNYFSAPLLLAYNITDRLSVIAGPQLDLLLKASTRNKGTSVDIIHETEERSLGLTAGVCYKITQSLQVETQYYHGLSHVGVFNNTTEFSYRIFRLNAVVNF